MKIFLYVLILASFHTFDADTPRRAPVTPRRIERTPEEIAQIKERARSARQKRIEEFEARFQAEQAGTNDFILGTFDTPEKLDAYRRWRIRKLLNPRKPERGYFEVSKPKETKGSKCTKPLSSLLSSPR